MAEALPPGAGAWRIALVVPSALSVATLRNDLVDALSERGHVVAAITPPAPETDLARLRELAVAHRVIDFDPPGLSFFSDWKIATRLSDDFRDWQPHVVMAFGLREILLAAAASRRVKVRRLVAVCTGLPRDFGNAHLRRLARALRSADALAFHNRDDARRAAPAVPPSLPTVTVAGAGVDLRRFSVSPLPAAENGLVFLMLAPLARSRGVAEYAAAARTLASRYPGTRFRLAGPPGSRADAIAPETLAATTPIEVLGHLADVRPALAEAHVLVHPSYGEGMPRAVLEALAVGRPVIATDVPGSRETVDDKVSGCLVPPGDANALAAAMESFVRRPDLLAATSRAARLKAERRFDVREVNRVLLGLIGIS